MTLKADTKYPSRRIYVVKVLSDATPDALRGRLENLVTCQQSDFTSASELFELMPATSSRAAPSPQAIRKRIGS